MKPLTTGERWAMVLAGGDGRRCEDFVNRLYSDGRPKQFCEFVGNKSLVEETLERASLFAPPQQTMVNVCRKHLPWRGHWERVQGVRTIVQPTNADTGPAVLLTTMLIERECPGAIVAVFPSDHFVSDTMRFMGAVREAANWIEQNPDFIVALGVEATYPETEYGWLFPTASTESAFCRPQPALFFEKPTPKDAECLLEHGALWNTSVLVYRTNLLLRLMEIFATDWWRAFDSVLASGNERFDDLYATLAPFNLSRDVLQLCKRNIRVLPLRGVGWCDLGNEKRIRNMHDESERRSERHRTVPSRSGKRSNRIPPEVRSGFDCEYRT